ncbi:hypothetical protein CFC21_044077, partial [Triticum aestivum]
GTTAPPRPGHLTRCAGVVPTSSGARTGPKDPATSLYTIPFHQGASLVLDIAGPLVWSTCQRGDLPTDIPCSSPTCLLANAYPAPGCPASSCGSDRHHKPCKAYPYNPVTGACAAGSLARTTLVASTTNGNYPVSEVNVRVLAACAPRKLLASLPRAPLAWPGSGLRPGAAGSGGVHPEGRQQVPPLPPSGGPGVAIFGGGPLPWPQLTRSMPYTPLVTKGGSPAHYISVKAIQVEDTRVSVSERALVMLSTRLPYAMLRRDVYRPLVDAFTKALAAQPANGAPVARAVKPVAPFELCYDTKSLGNNPGGYWCRTSGWRSTAGVTGDDWEKLHGGRQAGDGVRWVRGDEGGGCRRRQGAGGDTRRSPVGGTRARLRHGEEAARVSQAATLYGL